MLLSVTTCMLASPPVTAVDIVVNTTLVAEAADGVCSLPEALVAAETDSVYFDCIAGSGWDRISLQTTGAIVLAADLPVSTESLSVVGPGADQLTIDGSGAFEGFRFHALAGHDSFLISGLSMTGFVGVFGAAVDVIGRNWLTVTECTFSENGADNGGGAVYVGNNTVADPDWPTVRIERSRFLSNTAGGATGGGAVRVGFRHDVVIEDSMFWDNEATSASGAGGAVALQLSQGGAADIARSTFDANSAGLNGGALLVVGNNADVASIRHSTVTGNSGGVGGGIYVSGADWGLENSIVAENAASLGGPDILAVASVLVATGSNFIGNNTDVSTIFVAGQPNANGNYVGDDVAPLVHQLGALTDNGGWSETRAPSTEPILDKGSCPGETADQRGFVGSLGRAVGATGTECDIGAMELGAGDPMLIFLDGFESGSTHRWSSI